MKSASTTILLIIITIAVVFTVMTLIGALILWVLGHFVVFEFSWVLVFAMGLIFSLLAGGIQARGN